MRLRSKWWHSCFLVHYVICPNTHRIRSSQKWNLRCAFIYPLFGLTSFWYFVDYPTSCTNMRIIIFSIFLNLFQIPLRGLHLSVDYPILRVGHCFGNESRLEDCVTFASPDGVPCSNKTVGIAVNCTSSRFSFFFVCQASCLIWVNWVTFAQHLISMRRTIFPWGYTDKPNENNGLYRPEAQFSEDRDLWTGHSEVNTYSLLLC